MSSTEDNMKIDIVMSVIGNTEGKMGLTNRGLHIVKKYERYIKAMVMLMFLMHGSKLIIGTIGIDTESLIRNKSGLYQGWLNTGRQGLVLLKYLLGNITFNPLFSAVMTLLVFPLAIFGFILLWDKVRGQQSSIVVCLIGGLLWISHPAVTEQLYFSLQSFEVSLGILLTAAALYLTYVWTENKRRLWSAFISVCLLLLTFSIYQAFVVIYIFGAASVLLLQALRKLSMGEQKIFSKMAAHMGVWLLVFFVAFIINIVVTKLFFDQSDYLTEQILWKKYPVSIVFQAIRGHITFVLFGRNRLYSAFYGWLLICSILLITIHLWKFWRNDMAGCITVCFFYLALQITPFLMTFLQGGAPALRSQLVLPAMTGFQAMLNIWMFKQLDISRKKVGQVMLVCLILLGFLGGMKTAKITWSLYYTDQLRYEQDASLGRSIIERIEQVCSREESESLPVVIVGRRAFQGNNSCVQGEVIGHSFFDWDIDVEPIPYYSTGRVLGFLHTLGADYLQAPITRMNEAVANSENMPVWPSEGCVQMQNGMVIVKLSDYE